MISSSTSLIWLVLCKCYGCNCFNDKTGHCCFVNKLAWNTFILFSLSQHLIQIGWGWCGCGSFELFIQKTDLSKRLIYLIGFDPLNFNKYEKQSTGWLLLSVKLLQNYIKMLQQIKLLNNSEHYEIQCCWWTLQNLSNDNIF